MKTARLTWIVTLSLVSLSALAGCPRAQEPGSEPASGGTPTDPGSYGGGGGVESQPQQPPPAPNPPPPALPPVPPGVHSGTTPPPVAAPSAALLNPAAATETAPARFSVEMVTTKGSIFIDVTRAWAPNGADRFYNLVRLGYFTNVAFFRVVSGFMAQTGIHGDPTVARAWYAANIQDDPVTQRNTRGMVSFATAGPNTRTTQFFISFADNSNLDSMGFSPFGRVRDMRTVDALYSGYGEGAPAGRGPAQGRIQREGNTYLRAEFPQMDYIERASVVEN